MVTTGSVSREQAAARFPFLAARFPGRRAAIREFTHRDPDFVFWIAPEGRLYDARDAHRKHVPRGYEHILNDPPEYGGFLRGRVASDGPDRLVVVYCREEALAMPGPKVDQFLKGLEQFPVPVEDEALVISDNGDLYGTVVDLRERRALAPG